MDAVQLKCRIVFTTFDLDQVTYLYETRQSIAKHYTLPSKDLNVIELLSSSFSDASWGDIRVIVKPHQ